MSKKKFPNVSENLEKGPGGGTEWDTVREKSLFPRGSRCVAEQQQDFAGWPPLWQAVPLLLLLLSTAWISVLVKRWQKAISWPLPLASWGLRYRRPSEAWFE